MLGRQHLRSVVALTGVILRPSASRLALEVLWGAVSAPPFSLALRARQLPQGGSVGGLWPPHRLWRMQFFKTWAEVCGEELPT